MPSEGPSGPYNRRPKSLAKLKYKYISAKHYQQEIGGLPIFRMK